MIWPNRLNLLKTMLTNEFGGLIVCAIGAAAAVLLHRKDKKCRLWPALPAIVLWLVCELTSVNLRSYIGEFLVYWIANFSIGYAAAWLVTDLVYFLQERKRKRERKQAWMRERPEN
ncbi:MAG: hypothetical protein IJK86_00855 [Lachnospiraceae bacterium]|nr:hypothetical protein [Lachnospiraceae bacterium]